MLHDDSDMAGQLERTLIGAYVGAADLGETLATARRVPEGAYDAWFDEWSQTARRARTAGLDAAGRGDDALAARAFSRAAEYWRQSYFFLRADLDDERVRTGYANQRDAFRQALPFLTFVTEPISVPFDPAPLSGYVFRPARANDPRPTVLIAGGFDSTAEEMHKYGVHAALEMGWNAVVWDGPGQGGPLIEHAATMRPDYETVLRAMVDWCTDQAYTDTNAIAVIGRSFGGYFAARGATGEHRIRALVCDPGQHDFTSRFRTMFDDNEWERLLARDPAVDARVEAMLDGSRNRFFLGSRMAAMGATTVGDWLRTLTAYTLEHRVQDISCPTLITEGEGDFASQSRVVFDALTCPKDLRVLSGAEGGGGHCCGLGQQLWQQTAFGWLRQHIGQAQPPTRA